MDFLVFSGNSNRPLAEGIVKHLGMKLSDAVVGRFSDGEIMVQIKESVRGRDVFIIQPTSSPTDTNLMELMIMVDALKRASVHSVTAVTPYFGYSRQDRATEPRVPITARLVAKLMTAAGIHRLVTIDLHSGQTQGFFDVPVDNLNALPVFTKYIKDKKIGGENSIIVSPDAGGVARARRFAKVLGMPLAIVDKRRSGPNMAKAMNVIGDVSGKCAILVDDMIDTAGTLTEGAEALKNAGASSVMAMATHGVLSGPAIERINNSVLEKVIITDTIKQDNLNLCPKIEIASVATILAESIDRIHKKQSITSLFYAE